MRVAVFRVGAEQAERWADEVWTVYDTVFGDVADRAEWQETLDRHAGRGGFRVALALQDDVLVGFGYGYTGSRGEYWSDRAAAALGPELADAWVGGHFELVELAVLRAFRGRGLGGRLHDVLTADLPHERALLSTSLEEDPAVRLYLARGWRRIGRLGPDVQILGLRPSAGSGAS
ncbi:hypothetical protein BH10ACT10_BH10ACT10_09550 [soil metagenome]